MVKRCMAFIVSLMMVCMIGTAAHGNGNLVGDDLWIRAVIHTEEKGPIEAVWEEGGRGETMGGHRVIWGYFYASPDDVSWGSRENPDLFVKIWFDRSGRLDVNFFHVSVPEIDVYSDYPYNGTPDEEGTTTMSQRYIRQYYLNNQGEMETSQEDGNPPQGYSPQGNPAGDSTSHALRIGAMIDTDEKGLVDALWYKGGSSATAGGHEVLWGYFYANPNDVAWGSSDNPDLFVKIWFDASGRVDVNFFHVSVPDIEVYSELPSDGTYEQKGTTILNNRYIRQEYSDEWWNRVDEATRFSTGNQEFKVEEGETSDPLFGFRSETPQSNLLPPSVEYSSHIPVVRDQGSTGSCTAWSTAYYYKTYQEVMEENWDSDQNAFSPMYLYAMQCRNYDAPWDFIRAWEILNNYGCAKLSTVAFEDFYTFGDWHEKQKYASVSISDSAHTEAKEYRCGEKNRLASLSQVRQALTSGPVLLGINYYSDEVMHGSWRPSPETNHLRYDPVNSNAGHAILSVGYDDSKFGEGAVKFVNSWGSDWAIDGYSWIKYSDFRDVVLYAMTIKDIPNRNRSEDTKKRPDAPANVSASDNEGPYIDIIWNKVSTAQYYRVFRADVDNPRTYGEIGTTYSNSYRDFPEPGVTFYYSVVSYNDIGESEHFASDTDENPYVDKGTAKGETMLRPTVSWERNDDKEVRSHFTVSNIDPTAAAMEVFVSNSSHGPWHSFGWIDPKDFYITWGDDSEYVGKAPFVKVVASNADGSGEESEPAQVGMTIVSSATVASIQTVTAVAGEDSIAVSWTTDGANADFFEVWRYRASEDEGNEWILLDYSNILSWTDQTALPGVPYYYAVFAVYQGAYSESKVTDEPVNKPIVAEKGSNLRLYDFRYDYGQLSNPVSFDVIVWNDGETTINEYSLVIQGYDWNEGNTYMMSEVFKVSDIADPEQLPLLPGYQHTLSFTFNVPPGYADGHYYSWGIQIDPSEEIDELYEDDNFLWGDDSWWLVIGRMKSGNGDASVSKSGSTRPFSKERAKKGVLRSAKKRSVGPIQYKKPSFCINHDK